MTTTRNEREANRLLLAMAMRERRRARPFEWYTPSAPTPAKPWANQLGFHQAPHTMRFLVPGNGWGKTTAAAAECMAWGMHTNQWQRTPACWAPWRLCRTWGGWPGGGERQR